MKKLAFSVSIYQYKVQNWNTKKKQLLNLFHRFPHKRHDNVITSFFDSKIKTNIISEEIELFKRDVGLKINLSPSNFWFQEYNQNMNHSVHNHGTGGFSSVCFIEYNKNYHKPTTFISPFEDHITGGLKEYIPDVEEGNIIFFPSNLLHYAPVNLSNKSRIIMSFNLHAEGVENHDLNYY